MIAAKSVATSAVDGRISVPALIVTEAPEALRKFGDWVLASASLTGTPPTHLVNVASCWSSCGVIGLLFC